MDSLPKSLSFMRHLIINASLLLIATTASAFNSGDRVQCNSTNVNVRTAPSTSASSIGTVNSPDLGTVQSSTVYTGSGFNWQIVKWDRYSQAGYTATQFYQLAANPAPSIGSITPSSVVGVPTPQRVPLTINGSNFVTGLTVQVSWSTGSATLASQYVSFISSTRVDITVATDVTADTWSVRVTNPDGKQSNAGNFTVTAPANPAPSIGSITPSSVVGVPTPQRVPLTINGSNFVNGLTVQVSWSTGSATLASQYVSVISSTRIDITVATDVTADTWSVRVTNPDGKQSNAANFTVTAPANPAPSIGSITPSSVVGVPTPQRVSLTINGSNFVNGLTVQVSWSTGSATLASQYVSFISSTRVDITVATDVTADTWSVRVTNPDGKQSNAGNFTVTAPANPAPSIGSITPSSVVGVPTPQRVPLTINGSNFVNGLTVQVSWSTGSATLASQYVSVISSTRIDITVATDVTADTWSVRVTNPDGKQSNAANFTVTAPANPAPSIGSITPSSVVGVPTPQRVPLTINGSNFVSGLTVQVSWSTGSATLASQYVSFISSTRVDITVATDVTPDTWSVRVTNPDGRQSNAATFTVTAQPSNPPSVTGVSPPTVVGSSSAQSFTVTGSSFVSGAKVQAAYSLGGYAWNDTTVNATFVNSTTLTVPITTQTTPDTWRVRVRNPDGQTSSNYATFTVTAPPNNPPSVTGVSPTTVVGSNSAQTFTVTGSDFVSGAKVQAAYSLGGYAWTDTTVNATFVNSTTLTVPITTQTTPDTWRVRVRNPDGQTSSNYATFTVTAPPNNPPSVTGVSPTTMVGSNTAQTFTIMGSDFVTGAKVQAAYSLGGYAWQDTTVNATFVNSTTLTVPITTQTTPDTWRVRVRNPDGQTSSNYATFTVTAQPSNPPSVTGVSPTSVVGSNSAQTFTISGSNFISGAKVQAAYSLGSYAWQDTTVNATFVNSTTLTVPITTQTTPDTWRVRVRNPDGQTSSNYATFTVTAQPANPPSVTGVSPNSVVGSNTAQTFTITGNNFVSGARVQAAYSLGGYLWNYTTTNATFINTGTLTVPITTQETPDMWRVRVVNPDGQTSDSYATFTVTSPGTDLVPSITSITPNSVEGSAAQEKTLTINGTNFTKQSIVYLGYRDNNYSQTATSRTPTFISSMKLAVTLNVGADADTWDVWVMNSQYSNQANFTVTAPSASGPPVLSVTPQNVSVLSAAGNISLSVNNSGSGTLNYTSSVPTGSTWLSISSGKTGGNSGTISVAYGNNNGGERKGNIIITADGAIGSPFSVAVTQAAAGSSGTMPLGIDTNKSQGLISTSNWATAAGSGRSFVYLKATSGLMTKDDDFASNSLTVRNPASGLLAGAYHFAYPNLGPDHTGQAEAHHFYQVASVLIGPGFLPPALDIEDDGASSVSSAALSQWIRDWIKELK